MKGIGIRKTLSVLSKIIGVTDIKKTGKGEKEESSMAFKVQREFLSKSHLKMILFL